MAKRRPWKPAVDTICDLHAFMPGSIFTASEFRRNALSPWMRSRPGEEAQFFKWARRHKLIVPLPEGRYQLTKKGTHVARKACHR